MRWDGLIRLFAQIRRRSGCFGNIFNINDGGLGAFYSAMNISINISMTSKRNFLCSVPIKLDSSLLFDGDCCLHLFCEGEIFKKLEKAMT